MQSHPRHSPSKIGFKIREPVGQREGQLGDGIRTRLSDVVSGNGHRVKVANLVINEILLDVSHHAEAEISGKETGILTLVFLEDIRLNGASDIFQGKAPDPVHLFV